MSVLAAWLCPWVFGSGLWLVAAGRPRSAGDICANLGYGFVLGVLAVGILPACLPMVSPQAVVRVLAPGLLIVGGVLGAVGWRWRESGGFTQSSVTPAAGRWLVAGLLALLLWHAWLIFDEARLRPLFAWDSWAAWSVKPKTWFLLDRWVDFVSAKTWSQDTGKAVFTTPAWTYPALLGRIQVWFAAGAGCWCETAFTVVWSALWAAMLLGFWGQLRRLGLTALAAMLAVFALGSLPLIDTHAALAGYADLWIAAVLGLAVLCWLRWQRERSPAQLGLGLALALCLPWIKLEGAVWLLLFAAMLVLSALPRRWALALLAAALLALAAGLAFGGIGVPLPGLGWVHLQWGELSSPALGVLKLGWHPVGIAMLRSLFTLPNWHLLWYLAPLILIWRWRRIVHEPGLASLALMLAGGALFLFVLFFLTDAAAWAQDYTSANRLVMHLVPTLTALLALSCAPVKDAVGRSRHDDGVPEPALQGPVS